MWKVIIGIAAFIAFAAIAVLILSKSGNVDMGAEKHGVEVPAGAASH